jgi:phage baseplate assembly protein V
MSDTPDWNADHGYADFGGYRVLNLNARVTLPIGDNTKPIQHHQTTGLLGETRNNQQRLGEYGFSSVPLPGAVASVIYQGGGRHFATIIATEDPRYRPTTLNPGESGVYAVDGAGSNGAGGVMWWCLQALLGKIAKLLGVTILIGDGNTVTLTLTGQTININGSAGDVVVAGVSLVHHVHSNSGGTGDSGPPVAS